MDWLVSSPFDGNILIGKHMIHTSDLKDLTWTKLHSEQTGIANLARIQGPSDKANTVFARLIIHSEKDTVKKIKFGYSDNVMVYVNSRLLYGGSNTYLSRDHRYLGTIGLFDEIYPLLNKGENEILFGVSEKFGSWGILAQIEDSTGIRIVK